MVTFTYDEAAKTLLISDRKGEFPGMLKERVFNVIPVSKTGKGKTQTVNYTGSALTLTL